MSVHNLPQTLFNRVPTALTLGHTTGYRPVDMDLPQLVYGPNTGLWMIRMGAWEPAMYYSPAKQDWVHKGEEGVKLSELLLPLNEALTISQRLFNEAVPTPLCSTKDCGQLASLELGNKNTCDAHIPTPQDLFTSLPATFDTTSEHGEFILSTLLARPGVHDLKIAPKFFRPILRGEKTFELRKNDRDFKLHDILIIRAYDPDVSPAQPYLGPTLVKTVSYILQGYAGLQDGYAILGLQ